VASLRLRTEPTVHQVDVILDCVERTLGACAARVRRGSRGEVRFRMPPPWQAAGAGLLRLVTSGEIKVVAGSGEPRRLRYELSFATLYALGLLATAVLVVTGWNGRRLDLLSSVLVLWGVVLLLRLLVSRHMRQLLASCAQDIIERRAGEREAADAAARAGSPDDAGSAAPPP
jgi:hypothetical protein